MSIASPRAFALVTTLAALSACAQGSEIGTGGGGFGGDLSSGATQAATSSSGHASSAAVTSAESTSASASATSSTGAGMNCDFTSPNACANATGVPSVSGDTGSDMQTRTGTTSEWLQVRVTEDDSSIFTKVSLSYTVTLTSPPGSVYDLVVYESSDGASGPNCGASPMDGTPNGGTTQTVQDNWPDTQGIGGIDNGRWLAIQVTHVSGTDCTEPWTLHIQGHT